ncbi:MAG: hypothetical protein KDJ80_15650 [Nitratireductor sp.]|nr:hypothetical protein [Nitratireductor sp.]
MKIVKVNSVKAFVLSTLFGCALAIPLLPCEAAAQAMSPMRGQVKSFTDTFALKVYPANPYKHRIRISVKVYDQDFREVTDARVSPADFTLGGNSDRQVTVLVPFDGGKTRKVRVCTESIPFQGMSTKTTNIKAQICGKFLGERVN